MITELAINFAKYVLPWIMSAITIWQVLLAGNQWRYAWLVGLFNQSLWLCFILAAEAYGLLPMNMALWIVYTRNHIKWTKKK
jgi:hypothetical protein